jgi:hypothetical protein
MIDMELLQNIMKEIRNNDGLLDSFSPNQFKSKLNLINHVNSLGILDEESEVVIFGSWFGSILVPALYDDVKKITMIDEDPKVIHTAKYDLFKGRDKIDYITGNVFEKFRDTFSNCTLFINTSCEHMPPMKEWGVMNESRGELYKNPWWERVTPAYFAFQSNDMFDIPTHNNCVSTIEEFKAQLPPNAKVLIEDEIQDERGSRFTLIGKL